MRRYFHEKKDKCKLIATVVLADNGLTPLKLREMHDELPEMIQQRKDDCRNKWRGKAIHEKFAAELSREYVDQTKSHEWLKKSGIFP